MNKITIGCLSIILGASLWLIHAQYNNEHNLVNEKTTQLITQAEEHYSDALIVCQDGKELVNWYRTLEPQKIQAFSITKSVMSLLIGALIQDKKLTSLDISISNFVPEWKNTPKEAVTIRHILSQTTGLMDYEVNKLFNGTDLVLMAKEATLAKEPGSLYQYSNTPYALLGVVITSLTGTSTEEYCIEKLFAPLNITDYNWDRDQVGNVWCFAGLHMYPADLIKIGELVRNGGRACGKQLIDADYVKEMVQPSQPYNPNYGLSWWIIYASADGSVGYKKHEDDKIIGYHATGYLGQEIIVFPDKKLVAARMHQRDQSDIEREEIAYKTGDMMAAFNPLQNPVYFWELLELVWEWIR